jgi:hypothetical protein
MTPSKTDGRPAPHPATASFQMAQATTIGDIAAWAVTASMGQERAPLYIQPGKMLQFHPPAGGVRNEATNLAVTRACLVLAISNSLEAIDFHGDDTSTVQEAEKLLAPVLGDSPRLNYGHVKKAATCVEQMRSGFDAEMAKLEAQVHELGVELKREAVRIAAPWDELRPPAPWTTILKRELLEGHEERAIARGIATVQLKLLTRYIAAGEADLTLATHMLHVTAALRFAFMESCREVLESERGSPKRIAQMLCHVSDDAIEATFLTDKALRRLTKAAHGAVDPAELEHFASQLEILKRNSKRYETFLRECAWADVPSLKSASREFLLEMFDRCEGRFDSYRHSEPSAQGSDPTDRVDHAEGKGNSKAGGARALPSWEKQKADANDQRWQMQLGLLGWSDAAPEDQAATCELFFALPESQLRRIFTDSATLAQLQERVAGIPGDARHTERLAKFAILQENAGRMDEFLKTDIARDPAFDDVDLALLVPWWEAVKDKLPSASRGAESAELDSNAREVVVHAAPTVASSPADAPQNPVSSASTAARPKGAAAPAREYKDPAPQDSQQSTAYRAQRPHKWPYKPSADPRREDRPPTGRERQTAEGRSGHHRLSRLKDRSKAERDKAGRNGQIIDHLRVVNEMRGR